MVKAKKGKHKKPTTASSSHSTTPSSSSNTATTATSNNVPLNHNDTATSLATINNALTATKGATHPTKETNLDDLNWLRECDLRQTISGEPYLQLEYQDDDDLIVLLNRFLDESAASVEIIDAIYQIWQQTVLSTLLQSNSLWKKDNVTARDQKLMKDTLKLARYKIHFLLHHVTGGILTSPVPKWIALRDRVLDRMCYNTLQIVPRLAESCPHHPTDIRLVILHFEGKEFLASVACETWDTLYDNAVTIDPNRFVPLLRRCAMLDILDKDWNMLGGWDDILKGIEAKCCSATGGNDVMIHRLPSDAILHEATTILRNARNSMQCKFFSVRFMKYTDDQAPQRWRYFPKCSAPACANIETPEYPHPFRCRKCWYFHYCSASCQEFCDNIMGLHPKFCHDTPASKSALCRKETEQHLGWMSASDTINEDDDDDMEDLVPTAEVIFCHACGIPEDRSSPIAASNTSNMKRCIQCKAVSYCSRPCQEWDWRVGGHRAICRPVGRTTAASVNSTPVLADLNPEGPTLANLN